MGRPPGSRSTQPLLPSGVPKEAASRSRLVAGRFTFMALLKSIRSGLALTSRPFRWLWPARPPLYLEMKAEFRRVAARRHKVRSTERRQEVIERGLIRQVDDREAQAPLVVVAMEEVVISHAGIEQVACSDPRRIVIVILRSRSRYLEPRRPVKRGVACHQWSAQCGENAPAEETSLDLLVCGKPGEIHWRGAVPRKGNGTSHQAAVIAPIERHPGGAFPRLVLHVRGLLKALVVIDAENRSIAGT